MSTESSLTTEDLVAAMRARKVASLRYEQMIHRAKSEGWSNTRIAKAVGLSEAAVRFFLARHPDLREELQCVS